MARLRSAPIAPSRAPIAQRKRQALKEKTNTTRQNARAPLYADDGNTEDLIKDAGKARGRPKAARQEQELVMTGGLGQAVADSQDVPGLLISEPLTTTDELAKSDRPLGQSGGSIRRPLRVTRARPQQVAPGNILDGVKQRMEETAREEAANYTGPPIAEPAPSSPAASSVNVNGRDPGAADAEQSDLSLAPSPLLQRLASPGNKERASSAQPGSALRPASTPAVESSILALKNFKRRARQPSMLAMAQQRVASARPSARILATDDVLQADEDELDDFEPDGEGTPLLVGKSKRLSISSAYTAARKRNSDDIDTSSGALGALRAKRQRLSTAASSDDLLVAEDQGVTVLAPAPSHHVSVDVRVRNTPAVTPPPSEIASSDIYNASVGPEAVVPSTEQEQLADPDLAPSPNEWNGDVRHDLQDGTMAEPASSLTPFDLIDAQERAAELAEPVTQITPRRDRRKEPSKPKPISTAILQALLPKRRQPLQLRRRKSIYDMASDSGDDDVVDASHLEEDEDELGGRSRRHTKATPGKRKGPKAKAGKSKAPQTARKVKGAGWRRLTAVGVKQPPKTYGKTVASDKENNGDAYESAADGEDESGFAEVSMYEAVKSRELEEAKRKFADVDGWEMEFESMSAEEHRSSSQQWR